MQLQLISAYSAVPGW